MHFRQNNNLSYLLQEKSKEGLTAKDIAELNLSKEVNEHFQVPEYVTKAEVRENQRSCFFQYD